MEAPNPELYRLLEAHKLARANGASKTQMIDGDAVPETEAASAAPSGTQSTPSTNALDKFLQELQSTAPSKRRPFAINLNGDTAILLAIPRPLAESYVTSKAFYYILTDPWLWGPADFFDFADFFLSLRHLEPEAYQSIGSVELIIRAIENSAFKTTEKLPQLPSSPRAGRLVRPGIDAILLANSFADHAHRPTLLDAHPKTPILAARDAFFVVKGWDYFKIVWEIPDKRIGGESPLPPWLNIFRLPAGPNPALSVSHGFLISWSPEAGGRPEGVLYAPHGVEPETVRLVLGATPVVQILALLHPVNETTTENAPASVGVDAGLEVYRLIGARSWLAVHDGDMKRSGLLAPFQVFRERSLEEALRKNPGPRPSFVARKNGGIFVLPSPNYVGVGPGEAKEL